MTTGDRVRIVVGIHQGKEGQITSVSNLSSESRELYRVELSANDWSYFYSDELEEMSPLLTKLRENIHGCECGVWMTGGAHSYYCRLFREGTDERSE